MTLKLVVCRWKVTNGTGESRKGRPRRVRKGGGVFFGRATTTADVRSNARRDWECSAFVFIVCSFWFAGRTMYAVNILCSAIALTAFVSARPQQLSLGLVPPAPDQQGFIAPPLQNNAINPSVSHRPTPGRDTFWRGLEIRKGRFLFLFFEIRKTIWKKKKTNITMNLYNTRTRRSSVYSTRGTRFLSTFEWLSILKKHYQNSLQNHSGETRVPSRRLHCMENIIKLVVPTVRPVNYFESALTF